MSGVEKVLLLSCGHLRADDGRGYPSAVCPRCRRLCEVSGRIDGYSYHCRTRPCYTVRKYGLALYDCQRGADKHQRKYPEHLVHVMVGNSVIEVRRPASRIGQGNLFDQPPF